MSDEVKLILVGWMLSPIMILFAILLSPLRMLGLV